MAGSMCGGDVHGSRGMHGRRACVAGVMHGRRACVAGRHVWQGGRGCAWQERWPLQQNAFLLMTGGSCRVSLVVSFGFLSQNFGSWPWPTSGILSFLWRQVEWRGYSGGGDTQTLPALIKFALLHSLEAWILKLRCSALSPLELPCEISQHLLPSANEVCSGRYTSYWNAYLF